MLISLKTDRWREAVVWQERHEVRRLQRVQSLVSQSQSLQESLDEGWTVYNNQSQSSRPRRHTKAESDRELNAAQDNNIVSARRSARVGQVRRRSARRRKDWARNLPTERRTSPPLAPRTVSNDYNECFDEYPPAPFYAWAQDIIRFPVSSTSPNTYFPPTFPLPPPSNLPPRTFKPLVSSLLLYQSN